VRIGTTLPQFSEDPERPLAAARLAEDAGLDGVFVFDHLWPLGGDRTRPALHSTTLLAAVVAETRHVTVGTLVARVGLVPDAVLTHVFETLARMAGARLVAGLGTGDLANKPENDAYGVPFAPIADRRLQLVNCCRRLREAGVRTWVGGVSPSARALAAAYADGWNGWAVDPSLFEEAVEELRRDAGDRPAPEATWGGQVLVGRTLEEADAKRARHGMRPGLVHGTVDEVAARLRLLADAGATWAVCAPLDAGEPAAVEALAEVRTRLP
jgi:alkanesulfonate monooxygenase SsuD/methylene tetrahydromethanopterin reductase-like flavin-dependent oxidoreductase (luciferase family)